MSKPYDRGEHKLGYEEYWVEHDAPITRKGIRWYKKALSKYRRRKIKQKLKRL